MLSDFSSGSIPAPAGYAVCLIFCDMFQLVEVFAVVGIQNIVEKDPAILWLSNISEVMNIKPLPVLRAYECAVYVWSGAPSSLLICALIASEALLLFS